MATKLSRKGKKKDERPAKKKYWSSRALERNKVRNLIKSGVPVESAKKLWYKMRQNRRTPWTMTSAE